MSLRDIFEANINGLQHGDPVAVRRVTLAAESDGAEAERGIARHLTDHYMKKNVPLDNDVRALLVTRLAHGGVDSMAEEDKDRIFFLIKDCRLEPLMTKIDTVMKTHMYPVLAQSGPFNDAVNEWDEWSHDEKLAYGQSFARMYARISGMPEAAVKAMDMPRDDSGIVAGMCQQGRAMQGCTVRMNKAEDVAFASMEQFDRTMYHELTHTVHIYLGDCARTGNFDRVDEKLRTPAVLLSFINHPEFYARLADQQSYEDYPIERHAEDHAQDFSRVMHNPQARMELVARAQRQQAARANYTVRPSR